MAFVMQHTNATLPLSAMNLLRTENLPVEFPDWHYHAAAAALMALVIILVLADRVVRRAERHGG